MQLLNISQKAIFRRDNAFNLGSNCISAYGISEPVKTRLLQSKPHILQLLLRTLKQRYSIPPYCFLLLIGAFGEGKMSFFFFLLKDFFSEEVSLLQDGKFSSFSQESEFIFKMERLTKVIWKDVFLY